MIVLELCGVYVIKSKDEVFDSIEAFVNHILIQFERKVKIFRSDNGTEFINNKMEFFFVSKEV